MKILIAEDEPLNRKVITNLLGHMGHEVLVTCDGEQAWKSLERTKDVSLVVLDWMMPAPDGLEICRRLRLRKNSGVAPYILLLTANDRAEDIVQGFEAGADDYLIKPFNPGELEARVQVGVRILTLQQKLSERVQELEVALGHVQRLQGLLPICAYCKKVRDDHNYWHQVESYISHHAEVQFSHGICPDCYKSVMEKELRQWRSKASPSS